MFLRLCLELSLPVHSLFSTTFYPTKSLRVISEETLTNCLDRTLLVEALRKGFKEGAEVPQRHHHTVQRDDDDATLLLMPAWSPSGNIGVKMVTVFPSNAAQQLPSIYGTYTLMDGVTGMPLAMMDGRILTLFRTAATSVLAATYLARKDAKRLLMIGTGALAPHIIATYAEVLGISEVRIWGRSFEKASSIATKITKEIAQSDVSIQACKTVKEAAGWADIISCATLSKTPLLHGSWLSSGTFIDLIGSYTPSMREADDDVIRRSSIFVDTRPGALAETGEIMIPIAQGLIKQEDLQADLFELTRAQHPGRRFQEEITCFKSVGYALEDLVAAELAFDTLSKS